MVSRSQKIRLGIFLIVSTVILLGSIVIISGSRLLEKRDKYYIRYQKISLTGLEVGSAVKYRGIRIGRIENIYIDEKDITSIIVEITIEPKVPIKEDTEAIVTLIGITGLKMIELQGGTNESKRLPPDSYITAGQSVVDMISGQAEVITQKLELILNNIAELTAIKTSLKKLTKYQSIKIRIFTDSTYCIGVLTKGWKVNVNIELVAEIKQIISQFSNINFIWVKGHGTCEGNKIADKLALDARKSGEI